MLQKFDLSSSLDGRVVSIYYSLWLNIKNYSPLVATLCSCKVVENVLSLEPIWEGASPHPFTPGQGHIQFLKYYICPEHDARQTHNYMHPGICHHQNASELTLFCIMFSSSCSLYNKKVSCCNLEGENMSINKICKDIGNGEVICEQNNVRMRSPSARRRRCGPLRSHRKWYPHQ